jgi:AraC-like DNA-binding protein
MGSVKLSYHLDLDPESVWLTVTPSQTAKSSVLYVQELGDFIAHGGYYTRREGLASYLIKYTLSGEGLLDYRGQTYTILPDQLFWIDCQNAQYYRTSPKTGNWRVLWVHFYGPTSTAYYNIFQMQNKQSPVITLPPSNRVGQMLRALISLYDGAESTLVSDVSASGILTQLVVETIRNTDAQREWLGAPEYIRQARSYLAGHYAERVTLDDLALRYSVSKFYFQKLFRRYTGYSPNEYLQTVRLNKAKEYLRTTDNAIAQIGCDVGIQNTSHFINLFKQHEGITPSSYRKNWYYE